MYCNLDSILLDMPIPTQELQTPLYGTLSEALSTIHRLGHESASNYTGRLLVAAEQHPETTVGEHDFYRLKHLMPKWRVDETESIGVAIEAKRAIAPAFQKGLSIPEITSERVVGANNAGNILFLITKRAFKGKDLARMFGLELELIATAEDMKKPQAPPKLTLAPAEASVIKRLAKQPTEIAHVTGLPLSSISTMKSRARKKNGIPDIETLIDRAFASGQIDKAHIPTASPTHLTQADAELAIDYPFTDKKQLSRTHGYGPEKQQAIRASIRRKLGVENAEGAYLVLLKAGAIDKTATPRD